MAKETVYNNTLVSGAADETLTYTRYVKDESSGKSTKELLDEKVNKTDQLGTTQIADKAVTTEKLENESVTTDKLDAASVTTDKVADANITTSKLADSSVETEKINNKAVTTDKLNDGAVDNSKLSPEAVTYDKVKDKAIITEKLNDRAVTTEKVEERAITNPKLGNQSVDGRVVREASLETKHFANGSVNTEKIKDGSVTNEKVADDTLGIEKFDPEFRKTIQAATGLPENLSQMIQDVDKSLKQLKEKDTDLQSQINDKQQQITANDDDISLLQTRSTQMEKAIKGISASGGASQASAVTYENTESGLDSITAQGAIDELASKKFNKENISQEFGDSKDKVVSQFAIPFREIESPEFIKVIVDSEDHFLFGIQLDGSIEWGKGIPAPIRAKLQEIIKQCQQNNTDILEAINAAKEELSSSITALQEGKVDKEEGKSLIEDEVKECFKVIEDKEFIKAITDADDKVLFGIYRDSGKPYLPLNEMYHVEQSEEFFALWQDAANHVLLGIRKDGQIIGEIHAVNALKQVISQLQSDFTSLQKDVKDFLNIFSLQDNEEYLAVEQDAEGKILSATNPDGSHYIHNAKSETIPEEFSHIEDPEGRTEITTDAEDRVLAYRDSEGKKHEHSMEIKNLEVSNLNLQGNCVNNIQDALKANGFDVKTPIDWSDKSFVQIPEPLCAYANIIGDFPTTKGKITKGIIQFNDMQGNYFEKYIEMDIHGRTSAAFKKKNYTFDFFNDKEYSDSAKLRFGDWVSMDSFYFQGWYSDAFRGIDIIGYQLYQEIIKTRGFLKDKPYKKVIYKDAVSSATENTNTEQNLSKNALCTPLGFPVVLYHEGKFFGVYTVMLKKNRENFLMDKKDYKAVMLDLDSGSIVSGVKDWGSFEIRNPKTLICVDGSKYDGDNPKELIDENSENYSSTNKDMVNTAKTKKAILGLANAFTEVQTAISENKTTEEIKGIIESHYDIDYLIDYLIFSNVVYNVDGWGGNWQWTTWDGVKWNPNPYDLNATFGLDPYGILASEALTSILSSSIATVVLKYYLEEIKTRFKYLRNNNIITVENIIGLFKTWVDRIGIDNFKNEFKVWDSTPSQRPSNLNKEYWERDGNVYNFYAFQDYSATKTFKKGDIVYGINRVLYESIIDSNTGNELSDTSCWKRVSYEEGKEYQPGDYAFMYKGVSFKFKCIKSCINEAPLTKLYDENYGIYGFFDSISRIYKWIEERIGYLDKEWYK